MDLGDLIPGRNTRKVTNGRIQFIEVADHDDPCSPQKTPSKPGTSKVMQWLKVSWNFRKKE
jgi:hypothetical protein